MLPFLNWAAKAAVVALIWHKVAVRLRITPTRLSQRRALCWVNI
jgi:hypothetical protein